MSTPTGRSTVFAPAEEISYVKNSIVSQQIVKNKAGNITLFAFAEGQQLSEHSAPFDAVLQVLDGIAKIHIAGAPYDVNAGEMIILPANIPHAVYATTAFKMLLTMIKEIKQ
ncbi:cupin domain-containing protein [Niabella aquatica]